MSVESKLFYLGTIFFIPVGIVYSILTGWTELVGTVGLFLTGGLSAMVGFYLWATAKRIDARPEDDPQADISEGSGEQGHFSPWSWWPLPLAGAACLVFLGMALGWWISFIGAGLAVIALVGWVFEYYRGIHAH